MKRIRKEWGKSGRTKVLGKPETNKLVKRFGTHSSSVITVDDIVEKINGTRVRETDELGSGPILQNIRSHVELPINIL